MPVPETNGEEWDRLEPASALDVLVELALHGEYNGLYGDRRLKDALELRGAALNVFDVSPPSRFPSLHSNIPKNFVRKEEVKQAIIQGMLPPEGAHPSWRISQVHPTNPCGSLNPNSNDFPTSACLVYPAHLAAQRHERHDYPLCHSP